MENDYPSPVYISSKWESKVSTTLKHSSADEIWPLFKNFFDLHKWFPTLPTSYGIHGSNGEVGCIRYCSGSGLPSEDGVSWSTERLIAVDPIDRIITYEIVESNTGFKSYVSTVKIVPEGDNGQDRGCVIEWSFSVEPVEGWVLEDLVKKYEDGLQGMAKNMEEDAVRRRSTEQQGQRE